MPRMLNWLTASAALFVTANADSVLRNEVGFREICGGVYGPDDGKGPFTPAVNVSFPTKNEESGEIAVLIFDFDDYDNIGFTSRDPEGRPVVKYMCDQDAVYAGDCSKDDLGKFMVNSAAADRILSERVQVSGDHDAADIHFEVKRTGYYCVAARATPGHESMKFAVDVRFQNPFGHLPGADHPLILFHFVLSMVYVAIMVAWTVPLVIHRHSVLKVQKYITAMGVLMIFEQFFVSLYYYLVNRNGNIAGTKAMLVFVAFWASARLAFTFFLLLIVGYGYSVVHPSLGDKMKRSRILGGALFITAFLYSTFDYYENNTESSQSWLTTAVSVMFFPLVFALAVNYYSVLTALGETITYLRSRKQTAKVSMYRSLTFILFGSLIAAALQVAVLMIQLVLVPLKDFVTHYWKYKWVLNDGWPNIVYMIALMLIMFIWRPSKDNMRYAMSTQLSQNENDAEEFEIGSLNGSDDEFPEEPAQDEEAQYNHSRAATNEQDVGAQRNTFFDAEADHGLSDLESGDDFEVRPEDRNPVDDEDPLVQAPSHSLRKDR